MARVFAPGEGGVEIAYDVSEDGVVLGRDRRVQILFEADKYWLEVGEEPSGPPVTLNGEPAPGRSPMEDGDIIGMKGKSVRFSTESRTTESLVIRPLRPREESGAGEEAVLRRRLNQLGEVARELSSASDEGALLNRMIDFTLEETPADGVLIALLDEAGRLVPVAHRGGSRSRPYAASYSIMEQVIDERVAVVARDAPVEFDSPSVIRMGICSVAAVPLVAADRVLGVIYADSKKLKNSFDEGHLDLLCALGGLAAAALSSVEARRALREENESLKRRVDRVIRLELLVAASPQMRKLLESVERLSQVRATVLVRGETGTGKELIALALHRQGPRRERPFVPVNCAAIPESLIESELFGHVRGAFTGADSMRKGAFVAADGGTLFLDEIGDMPLACQTKLLRAIQERQVSPVGGDRVTPVDVRIVAATHRDLLAMAEAGEFREDLYYRLQVVPLLIPPLRERPEDVPHLVGELIKRLSGEQGMAPKEVSREAMQVLVAHRWPGNVRELANALERALVLCPGDVIGPDDLSLVGPSGRGAPAGPPGEALSGLRRALDDGLGDGAGGGGLSEMLDRLESRLVAAALADAGWNNTAAGRALGINERRIRGARVRHGLEPAS